ncbi:MAG: hypothetical protein ACLFR8_12605 [Alkalispirochaeta sp.]
MIHRGTITVLVIAIAIASGLAAGVGIFSTGGPGPFEYESIRGETIPIYGEGVYRHMSADVAVQGIGQDVVTLFLVIPVLIVALLLARRGGLRARLFLGGVLTYLFVQYLFYLVMGMYNPLFLVYTALAGGSFFALALVLLGVDLRALPGAITDDGVVRFAGGFLVFNAAAIGLMWLQVVVPPFIDGSIYPVELEHYTTLIVQGLDLGLLLPLSALIGVLLIHHTPMGSLLGPVYLVFLSFQMVALLGKLVAMGLSGVPVVPAIFIIPVIGVVAIGSTIGLFRRIREERLP